MFKVCKPYKTLSEQIELVLRSINLNQCVPFPFKFFPDRNLLLQPRLGFFVVPLNVAKPNCVKALFEESFGS